MDPVRSADVDYYDVDTAEILGSGSTNETGHFSIQISDGTVRNVSFKAYTTSFLNPGLFNASVNSLPSQGGQPYALNSPVYLNHAPGTDIDFTGQPVNATSAGVGGPFHIFDLAESAENYVRNLTDKFPPVNLTVYWSRGYDEGKYYDINGHIYLIGSISDDDSYDDNVILHEMGHYIALSYSADAGYYDTHSLSGTTDIRLSFTEGLGSYFMGAIRNYLNISKPLIYIETDGTNLRWFGFSLSYDTDTPSSYNNGAFTDTTAANEVAVGHALYDVVDGVGADDGTPAVDDDAMDLGYLVGDRLIWYVLVSIRENATLFTKEITMETFFDQWLLVNPGHAAAFTQILLDSGIEYAADAFEIDNSSASAKSILPDGTMAHHTFFPAGDEDWAMLTATIGEDYVVKTQDLVDGADTVLELYDSDGTTLLWSNNDRDTTTKASLVRFTAAASQSYYARITRFVESPKPVGEYGKYNLTVYIISHPRLTAVAPGSGPVAGGTGVIISGSNFTAGSVVRFGAYDAPGVNVIDVGTIAATTPANIPGPADVTVIKPPNADGFVPQGTLSSGFTYTGSPFPPIVRSITPDFATSSVPTKATVIGDFFRPGATVEFDAIPCATCTWVDARTISATIQPLPIGVYDIVVRNPDGQWDSLPNAFESAAYAGESVTTQFVSGSPVSRTLNVADDFEIMDLYVFANITHPKTSWPAVRIELTSPAGRSVRVFDRISVADSTGTTWRTHINATFGYDEAPSEVLWQFRGERTLGTWTLNLSSVLDGSVWSTLHGWAIYFFRFRHPDVSRVVLTTGQFRNYATGFDVETGKQLYRVRFQAADPDYFTPYPETVAVAHDQRHACGAGYTDFNNTRGGWTDSTVTCFELLTGKVVRLFTLSGNLQVDGLEVAADADRMVAATNEFVYRIDTTTMQITGSVSTGFPAGVPIPHVGVTPDGHKAYVTREDASFVIIVDLDVMAVLGQIDTPGYFPLDIDITGDGLLGYISCSESPSAFVRFNPASDTVIDTIPVSSLRPVQTVLTPDGAKAFYTHYQWYAGSSRKNLTTFAEVGIMPDPDSTTLALSMGRDGTFFLADWYLNRIWVYDSSSETLLKDLLVPDRPYLMGTEIGDVVGRVMLTAYGGNGYVQLDWSAAANNGTPVQGYTVYRGTASAEEERYATLGVVTGYTDLGVVNGQTYYYRVSASNAAGEGPLSSEATATPDVYFPKITNVAANPDPQALGGPVNITATVTDIPPISQVWVNVSNPVGGTTNSSMTRMGSAADSFYFDSTYGLVGAYTFVIWAENADGNWNSSTAHGFTMVTDTQPPEILEVRADPDPQAVGGFVNITTRVLDDTSVSAVWVNVSLPGGGYSNTTMTRIGFTDYYAHNTTYPLPGIAVYAIWATDFAGNVNYSIGHSFTIVDVSPPQITSVQDSPDPQNVGGRVNITATVQDNVAVSQVWANISLPGGGSMNVSMIAIVSTDDYYFDSAYPVPGTYSYVIWASDAEGNWAWSPLYAFDIIDTSPPTISNVQDSPDPQVMGGSVNVTATVIDDVLVSEVWLNVSLAGGGYLNASMAGGPLPDQFFLARTYATMGSYGYTIWSRDSSGNWVSSSSYFFAIIDVTPPSIAGVQDSPDPQNVGGQVNITATVTDIMGVSTVFANVSLAGGGYLNVSMNRVGATSAYYIRAAYSAIGTYSYKIWASDTSGNLASATGSFVIQDMEKPELSNVQATPPVQEVMGYVNISVDVTDNWALYPMVWAVIDDTLGSVDNRTMDQGSGDAWFLNRSYALTGAYSVTIWARDVAGYWNSTTTTFMIEDTTPPTAAAGPDQDILTGGVPRFNGSASQDNSGTIANYTWFVTKNGTTIAVLYGVTATYLFGSSGTYTVTLRVRDPAGNSAEDSLIVKVSDSVTPPHDDRDGGFPIVILVLIMIAILIAVILLALYLRRKRRKPGEDVVEEESEKEEVDETNNRIADEPEEKTDQNVDEKPE